MERKQIIVIICAVLSLIIFSTISIVIIKNIHKENKTFTQWCRYISVFCYTIFLWWVLCFLLGYTINIPHMLIGLFLCISGFSVGITAIERIKNSDSTFLDAKLMALSIGILSIIIGLILLLS